MVLEILKQSTSAAGKAAHMATYKVSTLLLQSTVLY